jgi:uncharacterized membrane protein
MTGAALQSMIGSTGRWIAIGAAMSIGIPAAQAQCTYSVQTWPQTQCSFGVPKTNSAAGLNNLGAWCGHRLMCYPDEGEGYLPLYCPPNGTPQVLPMPPGAGPWGAQATAVNDAGVVVGFFSPNANSTPNIGCIWWPDGTITVIPPLPGQSSSKASGINDSNVVAGRSGGQVYLWNGGFTATFSAPGGATRAISNAGHVVGTMTVAGKLRACRWHEGTLTVLQPHGTHLESGAFDVNDAGVVAGYSQTYLGSAGYPTTPTIWIDGTPVALPLPAGYVVGVAWAINDSGLIVGNVGVSTTRGASIPVLWIDGAVHLVNDLTVAGSPSISQLIGTNEPGQLLQAGSARVLTPTAPSYADLNGDCAADGADIAKLLTEWGPREWSVADIDGDGVVNGVDLGLLLGAWTGSK